MSSSQSMEASFLPSPTLRNSRKDADRYNTESFIYKMNNFTGKFSFYQTINTIGVEDMEHFTIADKYYLAFDNFQSHLRGD